MYEPKQPRPPVGSVFVGVRGPVLPHVLQLLLQDLRVGHQLHLVVLLVRNMLIDVVGCLYQLHLEVVGYDDDGRLKVFQAVVHLLLYLLVRLFFVFIIITMMMVVAVMPAMMMVAVRAVAMMVMVTMFMLNAFIVFIQLLIDLLDLLHQGVPQTFGVQAFHVVSSVLLKFLNLATDISCQLLGVVLQFRLEVHEKLLHVVLYVIHLMHKLMVHVVEPENDLSVNHAEEIGDDFQAL